MLPESRIHCYYLDVELYRRSLDITQHLSRGSVFLFGARATGKTTLLRNDLPDAHYYDLLDNQVYSRLLRRPRLISEETAAGRTVVIDEVQKLPGILDEVHRLIAHRDQRFVLTGSSARKLKRGAANLLAGRARNLHLFPLLSAEIPDFDLVQWMRTGSLPAIYGTVDAHIDLMSYVDLYIREEIQAESLTRNVAGFSYLLDSLALMNGEELNYASIASDTGIPARTIGVWLEILEDTMIAFRVPVFRKTRKRKATSRPKFWIFDRGVVNALTRSFPSETPSPEELGRALEHLIVLETRAWMSYHWRIEELSWWRSRSGFEVDLMIGDKVAVEVKATDMVIDKHLKGIRALREDLPHVRAIVVSQDETPRKTQDSIEILPWRLYLEQLAQGEIYA